MQKKYIETEINAPNSISLDAEKFVPIDASWREKYYSRVWNKRQNAYLLDSLLSWIFFIPGIFIAQWIIKLITYFINKIHGPFVPDSFLLTFVNNSLIVTNNILLVFFMFAPLALMESSKWKGTIGKRIMKIEITDDYGNRISFWRSFWRICLKSLFFYSYFLIIPLFIQISSYKKTKKLFHDHFSNTIIGERL